MIILFKLIVLILYLFYTVYIEYIPNNKCWTFSYNNINNFNCIVKPLFTDTIHKSRNSHGVFNFFTAENIYILISY